MVHCQDGLRWGGYVSALCDGDLTAPHSEASGLLLATLWILQLLHCLPDPAFWCEIVYDCHHTAHIAQGLQAMSSHHDIHCLVRSFVQWIEVLLEQSFWWTYRPSHQGDPWNEAADAVCRSAQQTLRDAVSLGTILDACTFDHRDYHSAQWPWLLEKSCRGDADAPLLIDQRWIFGVAAPLLHAPQPELHPAVQRRQELGRALGERQWLYFRAATANVLTLFPGQSYSSSFISAPAEALEAQFIEAGLHAVGLQETSAHMIGHCHSLHFHVLSAPATQRGQGGVQLWLRKHICVGEHRLQVDASDLRRILHASSRRLIARWANAGSPCPLSGAPCTVR